MASAEREPIAGSGAKSPEACGIFGRPFAKRFAVCYRTVLLSVTLVRCGQTLGRMKMKLGMQVGLGPGHIVLDGDPASPPQRGTVSQFSAHISCGQTAEWIEICHLVWRWVSAQATL